MSLEDMDDNGSMAEALQEAWMACMKGGLPTRIIGFLKESGGTSSLEDVQGLMVAAFGILAASFSDDPKNDEARLKAARFLEMIAKAVPALLTEDPMKWLKENLNELR